MFYIFGLEPVKAEKNNQDEIIKTVIIKPQTYVLSFDVECNANHEYLDAISQRHKNNLNHLVAYFYSGSDDSVNLVIFDAKKIIALDLKNELL